LVMDDKYCTILRRNARMSAFHHLNPGIWLMRRLHLRNKLTLIAVAALLPLAGIWAASGTLPSDGLLAIALGGATVLVYLILSFYVSFMSDFRQLRGSMEEIASGNLRAVPAVRGHDDLAD